QGSGAGGILPWKDAREELLQFARVLFVLRNEARGPSGNLQSNPKVRLPAFRSARFPKCGQAEEFRPTEGDRQEILNRSLSRRVRRGFAGGHGEDGRGPDCEQW